MKIATLMVVNLLLAAPLSAVAADKMVLEQLASARADIVIDTLEQRRTKLLEQSLRGRAAAETGKPRPGGAFFC